VMSREWHVAPPSSQ